MIKLGLTGSMGMGKTTVAAEFRALGIPVHDADAAVHFLLKTDEGLKKKVGNLCPEALNEEGVDRKRLGDWAFEDPSHLKSLETLIHPYVSRHRDAFIQQAENAQEKIIVFEIPLLFEKGFDILCDYVIVVHCQTAVQKLRLSKRQGLTAQRVEQVRAVQMEDAEKCRRADFVLNTEGSLQEMRARLQGILDRLQVGSFGAGVSKQGLEDRE